ncbi:hypothetical protein BJ508DRAFT_313053 [Ascobolus immersus RN42]|uniref:Uncharacterized protein n=1 Tax=Ascobolus immersus RN42 TaxID=1160509 RepID=A0A3N4HR08_ASCIM|nr:hypothetical protein BJ508DRAFT_313053 [Ascobolus immersus RN42]
MPRLVWPQRSDPVAAIRRHRHCIACDTGSHARFGRRDEDYREIGYQKAWWETNGGGASRARPETIGTSERNTPEASSWLFKAYGTVCLVVTKTTERCYLLSCFWDFSDCPKPEKHRLCRFAITVSDTILIHNNDDDPVSQRRRGGVKFEVRKGCWVNFYQQACSWSSFNLHHDHGPLFWFETRGTRQRRKSDFPFIASIDFFPLGPQQVEFEL